MNFLNSADALPMYVGAPKMIPSTCSRVLQYLSISSTPISRLSVPSTLAAPRATASATFFVCP
jgi:hypothetical protein